MSQTSFSRSSSEGGRASPVMSVILASICALAIFFILEPWFSPNSDPLNFLIAGLVCGLLARRYVLVASFISGCVATVVVFGALIAIYAASIGRLELGMQLRALWPGIVGGLIFPLVGGFVGRALRSLLSRAFVSTVSRGPAERHVDR